MDEDEDDRKSLEEPLMDGDVTSPEYGGWDPTASDAEAWLEEQEADEWLDRMEREPDYGKEGEEIIHPVPVLKKTVRPRRWEAKAITRPI